MIKIDQKPYASYLVLRHETDGSITPDGSLVHPVITECRLKIPAHSLEAAEMIVEEIRAYLDDCGAIENEDDEE